MNLGPHTATILACYGAVLGVIATLIVWLVLDGRRHARALAAIEARGIRRRSADAPTPAAPERNTRA